jgi:hypothetical protein
MPRRNENARGESKRGRHKKRTSPEVEGWRSLETEALARGRELLAAGIEADRVRHPNRVKAQRLGDARA